MEKKDTKDVLVVFPLQYFRMELMHAEKLRKEKQELEKADMDDLVRY